MYFLYSPLRSRIFPFLNCWRYRGRVGLCWFVLFNFIPHLQCFALFNFFPHLFGASPCWQIELIAVSAMKMGCHSCPWMSLLCGWGIGSFSDLYIFFFILSGVGSLNSKIVCTTRGCAHSWSSRYQKCSGASTDRDTSSFAIHACSLAALPRSSPFVLWTFSQNS